MVIGCVLAMLARKRGKLTALCLYYIYNFSLYLRVEKDCLHVKPVHVCLQINVLYSLYMYIHAVYNGNMYVFSGL